MPMWIGGAMYRQRVHFYPRTMEAWSQLMMVGDEYNKLAVEKGWAQVTYWMPTVGEQELVAESEYSDLADLQRETREMFTEPAAMAVWQKIGAVDQTRPSYSELLEPSPSAA
jgi:hypothetical protein